MKGEGLNIEGFIVGLNSKGMLYTDGVPHSMDAQSKTALRLPKETARMVGLEKAFGIRTGATEIKLRGGRPRKYHSEKARKKAHADAQERFRDKLRRGSGQEVIKTPSGTRMNTGDCEGEDKLLVA